MTFAKDYVVAAELVSTDTGRITEIDLSPLGGTTAPLSFGTILSELIEKSHNNIFEFRLSDFVINKVEVVRPNGSLKRYKRNTGKITGSLANGDLEVTGNTQVLLSINNYGEFTIYSNNSNFHEGSNDVKVFFTATEPDTRKNGSPNDSRATSNGSVSFTVDKTATSIALADPYIYPMRSSTPVKLPDLEACYRLYQSKDTFINAEVAIATKEHEKRMMEFVEKLGEDTKDVIIDGYFFSKFFIADGKNKMVVDLREKTFSLVESSDKTFFNISQNNNNAGNKDWNGKAKNVVVEWVTEEGNQMKATVSFFANPHIENGISLSVSNLPQKALGLCVSNYRPKLMRVPSLTTEKYAKIAKKVKKSRNPFQKIAIKSNREGWVFRK